LLQRLLRGAAIEVGIVLLRCQLHGAGLISDRALGIPQHQAHIAAVAEGSRILGMTLEVAVPERQCLGDIPVTARQECLIKEVASRFRRTNGLRCKR